MDLVRDVSAVTGGTPGKMRKVTLFETPRFFADVYVLQPGQAQAAHAHAGADKVYVGLSGRGVVRVGSDAVPVREGIAVHCPAGAEHGVENDGDEDLRLLVFMAPHPRPPGAGAGGAGSGSVSPCDAATRLLASDPLRQDAFPA